jgi:hypothetical protein
MGAIFNVFPLVLIPVLIYNIWAVSSDLDPNTTAREVRAHLEERMFCVPMASREEIVPGADNPCTNEVEGSAATAAPAAQAQRQTAPPARGQQPAQEQQTDENAPTETVHWVVSFGDLLVLLSLLLLFIELLKSTSTGTAAIFNHALSMLVFIVCLVEFLLAPAFATSVFFTILVMSLLDVLAGVVVTIVSARRDVEFAGQ